MPDFIRDVGGDEALLQGTSYINGKPQGTVFGADVVTAQENAEMSGKWDLGLNITESKINIVSTGYAKVQDDESVLLFGTGIAPDGAVIYTSAKRIRYEPGTPIYAKFTASFPELSESNGDYTTGIGLGEGFGADDSGIGMYQRRVNDELEYGVILVRKGVATYFPYNGILPPNPEYLNIYRIEWGYLGVAPFNIYWRDTDNEKWVRMHRQKFSQKITSLTKPDLPVGIFVINQGNTTDIKLGNGSFEAGTINGGKKFDPSARQSTYRRLFAGISGTNNLIFAFRNPISVDMYGGVDISNIPSVRTFKNSIASQLLEVGLGVSDNNKIVNVRVIIVPSEDLADVGFTPIELGYSVIEVSQTVTPVITNGRIIEIFSRSKDESKEKVIQTLDLLLPGQTALFIYSTTSVGFDFSAFIKFQDLF